MRGYLKKKRTGRAVLIVGHGSRLRGFNRPMKNLARDLKRESVSTVVALAYLEITRPTVGEALETLVENGASDIRILPYFLLTGRHVKKDLPKLVSFVNRRFKNRAKVSLCPYLGYDRGILETVKRRLRGRA